MSLRCLAPGKVNLSLYVGAPRADGLHPLVSVVQPVSLAAPGFVRGYHGFDRDDPCVAAPAAADCVPSDPLTL